jgi:NitT/TauT family transport system permease protein/taurine transport system permease protein
MVSGSKPNRVLRYLATGNGMAALSMLFLLAVWAISTEMFDVPAYVIPSPGEVAEAWWNAASSGKLLGDASVSVERLLLGAVVGIATGFFFGFLIGLSESARIAVEPVINFMSGMAGIAWIPLALAWFGTGFAMSTFVIWNGMFFVVVANTALGVSRVQPTLIQSVRTLGGSRFEILRSVILPGALPDVLTGVRVGLAFGWRSLLAAELLGAPLGLGQWVNESATFQRTDRILAGCITIAVLGVIVEYLLVSWIANRTVVRWGTVTEAAQRSAG